jgi:hypothetical protein
MTHDIKFNDNKGPITINNEQLESRASVLGRLIEIIANGSHDQMDLSRDTAEIDVKINFNNLNSSCWVVREYVSDSMLVDSSIKELNKTILNGSTKLKRQMKRFYLEALTKNSILTSPFDISRLKQLSDQVVFDVIDIATRFVQKSSDLKKGYYKEDIDHGVALITSYSIIECIVLENPNDYN